MDKQKIGYGIGGLIVLALAAWLFGFFGGTDPVVAEMQQLREQMRDLPEAERRAQWESYRQRYEGLTEAQRNALRDRGQWQQVAQQRMDEFFQLPPDRQRQQLDEMIDRMEQRRKERAQNPNANRAGRGDRGRNMSEAQRDQRRKERLDRTSPKMRAQFTEFGRRMNERRAERGLPPVEGGGRGGPWRG